MTELDPTDPGAGDRHVVLTGAARGTVLLEDGTRLDVTPSRLYFDTVDQAQAVAVKVAEKFVEDGHPDHDWDVPFVYDAELSQANFAAAKEGN